MISVPLTNTCFCCLVSNNNRFYLVFCVYFERNFLSGVVDMTDSHYNQRVMIQFSLKSGEIRTEIFQKLHVLYGDMRMLTIRMFEWVNRFKQGCEVASVTTRTDSNVDRLITLNTCDGRLSIRTLYNALFINKEIVYKLFYDVTYERFAQR